MLMYGVRPFGKAQEPQPECQVIIYAAVPSRFRLKYWLPHCDTDLHIDETNYNETACACTCDLCLASHITAATMNAASYAAMSHEELVQEACRLQQSVRVWLGSSVLSASRFLSCALLPAAARQGEEGVCSICRGA